MPRFHLKIFDKVHVSKARRSIDEKTAVDSSSSTTERPAQDSDPVQDQQSSSGVNTLEWPNLPEDASIADVPTAGGDAPPVDPEETIPAFLEQASHDTAAASQQTPLEPFSRTILASAAIEKLPTELFDQIMERLSMADKAALTYASSWLYQETEGVHVRELSKTKNLDLKLEFLDRLWTYLPDHDLCVGCAKNHLKTAKDPPSQVHFMANHVVAWEKVARKAYMRYQIRDVTDLPSTVGKWSYSGEWLSHHDDNQFVTLMMVITYQRPLTLALTHEAVIADLPSCIHSPDRVQIQEFCKAFIAGAPRPWQPDLRTSKQKSDLYRCYRCPTEFQFSVKPYIDAQASEVDGAFHMLKLVHVIDLGSCYTAHNRTWSALTTKGSSTITSTDPCPLTMSKSLMYHAINGTRGRSDDHDYKVVALTH